MIWTITQESFCIGGRANERSDQVELLDVLISEKWLLSAALFIALAMVNRERLADKNYYRGRERELTKLIDAVAGALKDIARSLK